MDGLIRKLLTDEQLKAYTKKPWRCPFCGSDNIEADSVDIEGGEAFQDCNCIDCEGVWRDIYVRKGLAVGPMVYTLPEE